MSFTWKNGRQLATFKNSSSTVSYTYNADGVRIGKSGSKTITYEVSGTQIISEKNGTNTTYYLYDENGSPIGLTYKGTTYFYRKNLQGDIINITDSTGAKVVTYTYNAWGKLMSMTGNMELGGNNPFRYRGYYYDTESGLYYLNSRYYDPVTGRFVSPEPNVDCGEFDEGAELIGYNVYAYCANNPVVHKDDTGESIILCILIGAGIGLIAGGVFGAYRADKNGYTPNDGWEYWKYVVGYGVVGGAIGALVGWGAGALIAKYGVATAATSITKGGGARFSSFSALKRSLGSAGSGNQWHHIVEQCQIGKSGFSKYWIQNSNNVVNISNSVHAKISAYYSSIQNFTNGMTFRNWLAGQSFETQYKWGIKVLKMFGVKI